MKILLADDHALFREGLALVLKDMNDGLRVVEAGNFSEILAAIDAHPDIDLALVDLNMPGMEGFAGIRTLRAKMQARPVVVVSATCDRHHVLGAIRAGAAGYIPKTLSSRVMIAALKLVVSGGIYLPPEALYTTEEEAADQAGGQPAQLTDRQIEVLNLLAQGLSNKEIARELGLAEGTVKLHVTQLLKRLGVTNRTQAVVKAAKLGLTRQASRSV